MTVDWRCLVQFMGDSKDVKPHTINPNPYLSNNIRWRMETYPIDSNLSMKTSLRNMNTGSVFGPTEVHHLLFMEMYTSRGGILLLEFNWMK